MRTCGVTIVILAAAVTSGRAESDLPFRFDHDIAPYLARAGCAAAECHGGATGRGGFKLSLFATNARADYEAITQDLAGRRVDFFEPHRSLLLRKPTRQMKHKGGEVITRDSETYRALVAWIEDGAPFVKGEAGELEDLNLSLQGSRAVVTATFARPGGGVRQRDVSSLARFESTDARVASIDQNGILSHHGPGETWIVARYGALTARHGLVRRFEEGLPEPLPADHPLDEAWLTRLHSLGLAPAPAAADHQLLRRLYLDLCGRPPAPDEIRDFFDLPLAERVPRTVAHLVRTEEFTDQLARHLGDWFEIPPPNEDLRHTSERNARLRGAMREFAARDASLLDFAASMLESQPRREFVNRFGDPRDRAEFTGRALLGIGIGCARCHNHPMDRWSQAQHLQFSAFFTDPRPVAGNSDVMVPGMFFLPGDGQPVVPALLPIKTRSAAVPGDGNRSHELARFLRTDAADALARNAANRIFGILIGRHLVEAPDDHRPSNPAIHEPLLELLAAKFREGGFQLRPMIQFIANSQLYALASDPPEGGTLSGDPQLQYFARRAARPMSGDEFLRSCSSVLGVDLARAASPETPLAQQLHLLNSGLLQEWLRTPGNQVDAIFEFETDPGRQLEQLYHLILTRPPRPAERAEFLPLLREARDPLPVGRDLAFALLAGREFSSIR